MVYFTVLREYNETDLSQNLSKFFLKKNWAETFIFGDDTPGMFVGRRDELKSLKFALLNNDSGAILVSAVRGVGKTSFVHKALSEIEDKIKPIFVNSGHVVSTIKDKDAKKALLTSLIRAAYFEFKDKEIEELYYNAIGEFKEYKSSETSNETESETEINLAKEYNIKNLIVIGGTVLATLGITLNDLWANILGYIGLVGIPFTFVWKKKWTKRMRSASGKETIVENSIDYLELSFEKWLKKQKSKKLVFIIDELDKVEEKNAFDLIKEYKNLFSRSFAHFIFIAGQDAYQLTKNNRELSPKDGGTFPTLFTHSYYLPLPTTGELKEYLIQILEDDQDHDKAENLFNYLLFHAKNDYFDLKNLINDLILIEGDRAYLDLEYIRETDLSFYKTTKVYNYAALFCEKKYRRGKKFWEYNSQLQKGIFEFLNGNDGPSFDIILENYPDYITDLLKYLQRLSVIEESDSTEVADDGRGKTLTTFDWTGKYKEISEADELFEEEEAFLTKFRELRILANDLNYIENGRRYKKVYQGYDGESITGVNLHSTYKNYLDLQQKVSDPKKRMGVLLEDVEQATEEIEAQIKKIDQSVIEITSNVLEKDLKSKSNFYLNQTFSQRPQAFDLCPDFSSVIGDYEHRLFGTNSGSREVMIVENFEDFDHIQKGLSMMNNNRDMLVINLITRDGLEFDTHPVIYKDKIGRTRKKGMVVKNFYNYKYNGKITSIKKFVYRINQYFQYY